MTQFKHGSVKISNDIIDQLIAETALQVENVKEVVGYKNKKVDKSKKEGIVTVISENKISIALNIIVSSSEGIYQTAEKVQTSISEQVNTMLGLEVKDVNVIVKKIA